MKRLFLLFIILLSHSLIHANNVISDYTTEKIESFITYRVVLKSEKDDFVYEEIKRLEEEALQNLSENAIDFEQEECILKSVYLMEFYEHFLNSSGNQKELRDKIKNQMKKNIACIDKRKESQISDWMYLFTGDITAYYMTRSVAATLLHGFKLKGFYEKSIKRNPKRSCAYISLGNWCFYAPGIVGGGKGKAKKNYESALKNAELPGEQYLSYIAISQLNYENKNKKAAEEYLQKAVDLNLGRKDLDLIARCNKKGYSYFQYLRNRSGIDVEMSEDEKDEDDR
ncbi:MAG: hypothetical protein II821_07720 [Treponema sp.]|nr:hypothetical protein [Treponema sp.]